MILSSYVLQSRLVCPNYLALALVGGTIKSIVIPHQNSVWRINDCHLIMFLTVLLVDTRTSTTIEYSEAHRVGEGKTGGGDHIVGQSVFPLAWILNQPSAIHHPRCRLKCQTLMFDLNQSFRHFHPIPQPCPDTNTPSRFSNYHNPRRPSFLSYSGPSTLPSNYLPDRNGLPLLPRLSHAYHLRSITLQLHLQGLGVLM